MADAPRPTTLIATLGRQPQVVTFALDALLARNIAITEVVAVYLPYDRARLATACTLLETEFHQNQRYRSRNIRFVTHRLRSSMRDLADIRDKSDANAAWEAIRDLIVHLKNRQHVLHICISGGRRMLGLMTMSAAMLYFGHQDTLWHMHSPQDLQEQARDGALLHVPDSSGFQLIPVPMMPWGSYFPLLRQLGDPSTPLDDVLAAPRQVLDETELARCKAVVKALTLRQREVLFAFAHGRNPQQVAQQLAISIRTVDSHKTAILRECRNVWDIPEDAWLDYRFVAEKFGSFVDRLDSI